MVRDRGSLSDADTANRLPADDEMPTMGRPSNAPRFDPSQPLDLAGAGSFDGGETTRWKGDLREPPPARPDTLLDEAKTKAYRSRVAWLEEEARINEDPVARARALLVVSELSALAGDRDHGLDLAIEARDLAPQQVPLAWRQVRQLMPWDPEAIAEALDAEAHHSPTPSARAGRMSSETPWCRFSV